MSSQVRIVSYAELESQHTGTLLARLCRLRECEESFACSDRSDDCEPEPDPAKTGLIEFKSTPAWNQAWEDIKAILARREHLPKLADRQERRRQKAQRRPRFGRRT